MRAASAKTPAWGKGILVNFDPNHGLGIGIDLGGTKITFSLFNLNAELLAQHQESTYDVTTRREFLDLFSASIESFIEQNHIPRDKLKVIGIATPGIVDYRSGTVLEGSLTCLSGTTFRLPMN
jgi:predicted NBD/HSP70 family sugar kinase